MFIPHTKRAPKHFGDVLILGLGKSGKAACDYFISQLGSRVDHIYIAGGQENSASKEFIDARQDAGIKCVFGDEAVEEIANRFAVESFDICVASPGIPPHAKLYQDALQRSNEVISEVELAWRESDQKSTWIAITGTNGKTTTTAWCAYMLTKADKRASAVGNIGNSCITAVAEGDTDIYVVEVSSYQLESTKYFAPLVSIILNVTPDHLAWHQGFDSYRAAKLKSLENLASIDNSIAILDTTDEELYKAVEKSVEDNSLSYNLISIGDISGLNRCLDLEIPACGCARIDADNRFQISYKECSHYFDVASSLQLPGEHNFHNALAVASVGVALGLSDAVIDQSLTTFSPLEHRIEPCGQVNEVRCYNDSKGTNTDATIKALTAFPETDLIVLLGGKDKGTDLSQLISHVHSNARVAVCYGASKERFVAAFNACSDRAPESFLLLTADHLEDAFDLALQVAHPKSVVLLSPACASFDEFNSYQQRGTFFKNLVSSRAQ